MVSSMMHLVVLIVDSLPSGISDSIDNAIGKIDSWFGSGVSSAARRLRTLRKWLPKSRNKKERRCCGISQRSAARR